MHDVRLIMKDQFADVKNQTIVGSITDKPSLESEQVLRKYEIGSPNECGPVSRKLYQLIRGIQNGEEQDLHGWCFEV